MAAVLAYVSAALVAGWGVAHAIPTRQVLASFEPISTDNRRIILQEWLAEAFTMWGIAAVVIAATAATGAAPDIRAWGIPGRFDTADQPGNADCPNRRPDPGHLV